MVKAYDLNSLIRAAHAIIWVLPRRFEPCSRRYLLKFGLYTCFIARTKLSRSHMAHGKS